VVGPGDLGEPAGDLLYLRPEVPHIFDRDARVHEQAAKLVGDVGRSGLGGRLGEPVDRGHDLLVLGAVEHADVERAGDPAVEPLLDRPNPPGAHHAEEAGVDEKVHVIGDGALRAVDHLRHLCDRRGPLDIGTILKSWII
jgi:hypothetical protein